MKMLFFASLRSLRLGVKSSASAFASLYGGVKSFCFAQIFLLKGSC